MCSKHNSKCMEEWKNEDCYPQCELYKLRGPPGKQGLPGRNGESSDGTIINFGGTFRIAPSGTVINYLVPWLSSQGALNELNNRIILSQTLPFLSVPGRYVAKNPIVTITVAQVLPATGGNLIFTLGTVISSNTDTTFLASPIIIVVPYTVFLTVGQHQFNITSQTVATFAQGDSIAVQINKNITGIPQNSTTHIAAFDFLLAASI